MSDTGITHVFMHLPAKDLSHRDFIVAQPSEIEYDVLYATPGIKHRQILLCLVQRGVEGAEPFEQFVPDTRMYYAYCGVQN